jgi:hypothetical protein
MTGDAYQVGMLVAHPGRSEWGLGKVLEVKGNKVKIHFKDDHEKDFRTISSDLVPLEIATDQSDPTLDNLPPFSGDHFDVKAKRVTIDDGIQRFKQIFPRGFHDPEYLGTGKAGAQDSGERRYKIKAHEHYLETLGQGLGPDLLEKGDIDELIRRACSVVSRDLNLLVSFENMALRDGLKADPEAAAQFFDRLFAFIAGAEETRFTPLAESLLQLPVAEGKARVATWPVLTILPFLADPQQFMFLKPKVTEECAERLRFDIQYSSELRWVTYRKLMEMSDLLLERLRPLGAQDYIDVQSFIWVIAEY